MFRNNKQGHRIPINRNVIYPEFNTVHFNNKTCSIEIIELDSEDNEINQRDMSAQATSNSNLNLLNYEREEIVNAQAYYQQLYNETMNYETILQDVIADIYTDIHNGNDTLSTTDSKHDSAFRNHSPSSEENTKSNCTYNSHTKTFENNLPNDYTVNYYFRNDDSSLSVSRSSTDDKDSYSSEESIRVSTPITLDTTKLNVSSQPSLPTVIEVTEPIITSMSMLIKQSPKNNWVKPNLVSKITTATEIERYFSWIPLVFNDRKKSKKNRYLRITHCNNNIDKGVQVEFNDNKGPNFVDGTNEDLVIQELNINSTKMENLTIKEHNDKLEILINEYDITNNLDDFEQSEAKAIHIDNNKSEEIKKTEKLDVEIESIFSNNIPNADMIDLSTSESVSSNSFKIINASCVPPLHLSHNSKDNFKWLKKTLCMCCPWLQRAPRRKENKVLEE